ncbi:MAG TPA: hypothetical protein ENO08_01960 [Candidatus Eisenbacteria bacterium]|uniref:DUF4870 domain-containing protein n=1 Tax=Eiseniibacteriota bacterium TaxID=2212470 RepID=A0A7V2AU06_UNCEI|nr:hypothetical protein [Candidatus Eisenbacteria bacterium]
MEDGKRHTTSIPPGIAAAAAYFFPFIGGLVMLAIEKEDRFVRFHAAQSILFWVISIPIAVLSGIPVIGSILGLAFIVAWIFLIYRAWMNREFEIPYLGEIARKQVFGDRDGPAGKDGPSAGSGPDADADTPSDSYGSEGPQ